MKIHVDGGTEQLFAVAGGFMEVTPEKITVLATAAEEPDEIDINRAQRAYERAQERLKRLRALPEQERADIDEARATLALKRAIARLQTAKAAMPGA